MVYKFIPPFMGIWGVFYYWVYHINHIQIIPVNQPIYKDDTGF